MLVGVPGIGRTVRHVGHLLAENEAVMLDNKSKLLSQCRPLFAALRVT